MLKAITSLIALLFAVLVLLAGVGLLSTFLSLHMITAGFSPR
jgi:hypothetical protein